MNSRILCSAFLICFTALVPQTCGEELPQRTALDDYVNKPDDSYHWEVVSTESKDGIKTVLIDMVSQTWRTKADVNRTEWRHWLTLSIPEGSASDMAMVYISGGYNGEGPRSNKRTESIARASGGIVAQLGMIPNQRLMFHNDGKERTEDDLIGYTWDQYLKTGDPTWPARNPMVKSAVRAMDTITAYMASEDGGQETVDRFVVAGGSKRGWTTWLTGAVDDRVAGIIPIVIDVLNGDKSMKHHFAAYGFWAPNVGNYVDHKIMHRINDPRLQDLYRLVDPWYYRHRLTMPKLVLNAAGDQFFLPDSSQFYLDKTDAGESIIAFYSLLLQGKKPPQISWTESADGTIRAMTKDQPSEVRLWQATNPEARDFRVETLGRKYSSSVIYPNENGLYIATPPTPDLGWTAYFIEFAFDVGAGTPLKLTTGVKVTPDTIPFADKPSHLPTSVTLVCRSADAAASQKIADSTTALIGQHKLATGDAKSIVKDDRIYINWVPTGDFRVGAKAVAEYLTSQECGEFAFQLESGSEITLPPVQTP